VEAIRKKMSILAMFLMFIALATTNNYEGDGASEAPIYMIILFPLFFGVVYFLGRNVYDKSQEAMPLPISYFAFQIVFTVLMTLWAGAMVVMILEEHVLSD
jgi:hypothetical protein